MGCGEVGDSINTHGLSLSEVSMNFFLNSSAVVIPSGNSKRTQIILIFYLFIYFFFLGGGGGGGGCIYNSQGGDISCPQFNKRQKRGPQWQVVNKFGK